MWNVCARVFADGQTGSGKTHSMMGNAKDPGVIPRCATDIFERAAALLEELGEGGSISVRASYIQIYREVLQDLLGNSNDDLKIRRDPKIGTCGSTGMNLRWPSMTFDELPLPSMYRRHVCTGIIRARALRCEWSRGGDRARE